MKLKRFLILLVAMLPIFSFPACAPKEKIVNISALFQSHYELRVGESRIIVIKFDTTKNPEKELRGMDVSISYSNENIARLSASFTLSGSQIGNTVITIKTKLKDVRTNKPVVFNITVVVSAP